MEKAGFFLNSQKIFCQEVWRKTALLAVVRGCETPGKFSLAAATTPHVEKDVPLILQLYAQILLLAKATTFSNYYRKHTSVKS